MEYSGPVINSYFLFSLLNDPIAFISIIFSFITLFFVFLFFVYFLRSHSTYSNSNLSRGVFFLVFFIFLLIQIIPSLIFSAYLDIYYSSIYVLLFSVLFLSFFFTGTLLSNSSVSSGSSYIIAPYSKLIILFISLSSTLYFIAITFGYVYFRRFNRYTSFFNI